MEQKTARVVDANLNRLREGLRVIEDIFRYIYDDAEISARIKALRHRCRIKEYRELLASRDILNDCAKSTTESEHAREDFDSILLANFKRAQESSRVLEEIFKLESGKQSEAFKQIRYELYDLEKVLL